MKHLIIGIDGGDKSICRRMPMPLLNQLLGSNCTLQLTEDLLSRGWVEMVSGKYARDTKAFYMVPQCDGTSRILFKYSLAMLLANDEVRPIWELPPPDSKVAMMNVPTTFPAPEVNGFFVSGAGGGVNKVDGIPDDLCHPKSLAKDLGDMGYEIDIRFGTAGIKDIAELFTRLCNMMEKRAEAFVKLVNQFGPDFAFVTFRAPTVVQYLAMSEMQAFFDRQSGKEVPTHSATTTWAEGFEKLYRTLDECIGKVITACHPEHWIITSDHGAVPYKYRVNINRFLQDHGYQKSKINWNKTVRGVAAQIVKSRPFAIARDPRFDQSTAFGHWYLSGILVNDRERFGGPVDPKDVDKVTEQLCADFNSTQQAAEYDMQARPYRSLYLDSKYSQHLPDVKIHCSDEIFFSRFPGPFIRPNPEYAPLPSIAAVEGGMHTGQKGRHPLFCCANTTAELIDGKDPLDLTLVYKLTQRIFQDD